MRRLMYAGAIALLAIVFTVPSDFASMEGFTLDAREARSNDIRRGGHGPANCDG